MTKKFLYSALTATALLGVTSVAQAQVVGGCVGSCNTPPSFIASVFGGGNTGAINVSGFGAGGTGNSGSSVQDMLNINVTLNGAGNPSGFCNGTDCASNGVIMNLTGLVGAMGFAYHELTGANGQAGGTTANSASNVQFNGQAGGTWQYTGGTLQIPNEYKAVTQPVGK